MGNVKKQFDEATEWHPYVPNPTGFCGICLYGFKGIGIHRYDDIREQLVLRPNGMRRALELLKEQNETHR